MINTAMNSFSNYLGFAPKRPASQIIPQTPILNQALQTPVTNMQSPQMTTQMVQKPIQPVSTGVLSQGPKLSAPATDAKSLENAPWKFNADKFMENPWTKMGLTLLGNTSESAIADAVKVYSDATGDIKQKDAVAELNAAYDSGDFNRIAKAKSSALSMGVDPNVITSIDSDNKAKLMGMAATTGQTIDPVTGKTTYIRPIPLEELKAVGDTTTAVEANKKRVVGDIEVEQELAKQMGITNEELRAWKIKNPVEAAQRIGEIRLNLEGQEAAGNRAQDRADKTADNAANKNTATLLYNEAAKVFNDAYDNVNSGKTALSQMNKIESLVSGQSDDALKNAYLFLAKKAAGAITTETNDLAANIESATIPLAISFHPGGVMTDADLLAYKSIVLNPGASKSAQLANLKAQRAQFENKLAQSLAKLGGLQAQKDEALKIMNTNNSSQPKQTDSGGTVGTTTFRNPNMQ